MSSSYRKSFCALSVLFVALFFFTVLPQAGLAAKTVTIAEGVGAQSLDPHKSTVQTVMNVALSICEPLTRMDYTTMEVKPALATSWKLINPTTWEFKLREGVKFTNGEPFDANSVKYSLERVLDPKMKSPNRINAKTFKEIKVIDPHTIHIVTTGPSSNTTLYLVGLGMVPPKHVEKVGPVEFGKHPVGTGPFVLAKWVKDEYVELNPNENYWGGRAKVDRVIYKTIPETLTRMAALFNGEADLVGNVLIEEIPRIQKAKNLAIAKIPSLRTMFVQFNMTKESPVQDKRVRQALNYAVDVDSITKNVLQGNGIKLNGQLLSQEYLGYNPNLKPFPYDPKKALELIKAAGAENYEFTIMASAGRYQRGKEVAEVIGGQLNAAGIKTKVQIMEWGQFLKKMLAKELFPMGFWGGRMAPAAELYYGAMVMPSSPYSNYVNPDFEPLFKKAAAAVDPKESIALWHQIGEMCYDDPPVLYLYQVMDIWGINNRVIGFKPSPDGLVDLFNLDVKK
jgi:peptide/nickel transport system substrate-binding protein